MDTDICTRKYVEIQFKLSAGGNKGCKLGSSKKHLFKSDYKSVGTEMKNSLEKKRRNPIERHCGHESFQSGSIRSFQLGI